MPSYETCRRTLVDKLVGFVWGVLMSVALFVVLMFLLPLAPIVPEPSWARALHVDALHQQAGAAELVNLRNTLRQTNEALGSLSRRVNDGFRCTP